MQGAFSSYVSSVPDAGERRECRRQGIQAARAPQTGHAPPVGPLRLLLTRVHVLLPPSGYRVCVSHPLLLCQPAPMRSAQPVGLSCCMQACEHRGGQLCISYIVTYHQQQPTSHVSRLTKRSRGSRKAAPAIWSAAARSRSCSCCCAQPCCDEHRRCSCGDALPAWSNLHTPTAARPLSGTCLASHTPANLA